MTRGAAATLLAAAFILGGCRSLPPKATPESERAWQARQQRLAHVDRFTLSGRLSGGFLGVSGALLWRQRPQDFDLRVSGPIGVGVILISGTPAQVEIRTKDQRTVTDKPETLLREQMGWTLPLAGLRWWALGLPSPASTADVELDDQGRAAVLSQDGWRIEFSEYRAAGNYDLPRRFVAESDDATLKALVDSWTDLPEPPP